MPWGSGGGTWPGNPPWDLTGYPPGGTQSGTPRGGYLTGYPPGGGVPDRVPPRGGYLTRYPPRGGVPDRVPPRGGTQVGQQKEYSLHGGRYASCVHAGGLSCCKFDFTETQRCIEKKEQWFTYSESQFNFSNRLIWFANFDNGHVILVCAFLPTTYAIRWEVMFSQSVIVYGEGVLTSWCTTTGRKDTTRQKDQVGRRAPMKQPTGRTGQEGGPSPAKVRYGILLPPAKIRY